MFSPISGLKATNINNKKSTFVWLLHYTASRVHPVSTFPHLILKMRQTINNNDNNIKNCKEEQFLWREVKTEGTKLVCECVCECLVSSPSELMRSSLALLNGRVTCLCPSSRECCVLLDVV